MRASAELVGAVLGEMGAEHWKRKRNWSQRARAVEDLAVGCANELQLRQAIRDFSCSPPVALFADLRSRGRRVRLHRVAFGFLALMVSCLKAGYRGICVPARVLAELLDCDIRTVQLLFSPRKAGLPLPPLTRCKLVTYGNRFRPLGRGPYRQGYAANTYTLGEEGRRRFKALRGVVREPDPTPDPTTPAGQLDPGSASDLPVDNSVNNPVDPPGSTLRSKIVTTDPERSIYQDPDQDRGGLEGAPASEPRKAERPPAADWSTSDDGVSSPSSDPLGGRDLDPEQPEALERGSAPAGGSADVGDADEPWVAFQAKYGTS